MRVRIFQMNIDRDERMLKFRGHEDFIKKGGIDPTAYDCVFHGDLEAKSLDDVFNILNRDKKPGTYQGHSLSVSDIVEIIGDIPKVYGRVEFYDQNGKVYDWVECPDKQSLDALVRDSFEHAQLCKPIVYDDGAQLAVPGCFFCEPTGWQPIDFDVGKCAPMNGVRALMLQPGKAPAEVRVMDTLEGWQHAVSEPGERGLMEVTYPFEDNAVVVGNEEAKLIGMKGNRRMHDSVYAGPLFIVGDTYEGEFCDLTDEQIQAYSKQFETPEEISDEEVQNDLGYRLIGFLMS